jgi:hypothetical protein
MLPIAVVGAAGVLGFYLSQQNPFKAPAQQTVVQTTWVTAEDVTQVEAAVAELEQRDVPMVIALLAKGFEPDRIKTEERCVKCRSSHDMMLKHLFAAHPMLKVESRVEKVRECDDDYITDITWPILCFRVSPREVAQRKQ